MESTTAEQFWCQAVSRAGSSVAVTRAAQEVSRALAADEVVLEAAECLAVRKPSAVFVTNRRLLLGISPGQFSAVDLAQVTSYSCNADPDSSFRPVLRIFEARLTWAGFGPNGIQRITHALDGIFDHYRGAHLADSAETTIKDIYDAWRALQQEFDDTPELSAEQRHAGLVDVLANRRWW